MRIAPMTSPALMASTTRQQGKSAVRFGEGPDKPPENQPPELQPNSGGPEKKPEPTKGWVSGIAASMRDPQMRKAWAFYNAIMGLAMMMVAGGIWYSNSKKAEPPPKPPTEQTSPVDATGKK